MNENGTEDIWNILHIHDIIQNKECKYSIWQNHEEQQYLNCLYNIITNGIETQD